MSTTTTVLQPTKVSQKNKSRSATRESDKKTRSSFSVFRFGSAVSLDKSPAPSVKSRNRKSVLEPVVPVLDEESAQDLSICEMDYPTDPKRRSAFRRKNGKPVTPHQWAVYDYIRKIPRGKVTTYKGICDALGQGSPRSVGTALHHNPFAPFVPCHRIIASNLYIGGFSGEWNRPSVLNLEDRVEHPLVRKKVGMLAREGVGFNKVGMLIGGKEVLWRGVKGRVVGGEGEGEDVVWL